MHCASINGLIKTTLFESVKTVNIVLLPVQEFTEPYVDDAAVHPILWDEHLKHIKLFLVQMRKHNLTLNLNMFEFGKAEIHCLGHKRILKK